MSKERREATEIRPAIVSTNKNRDGTTRRLRLDVTAANAKLKGQNGN